MCGGQWLDVPNSGAPRSSLCPDAALKNAPRCMQPLGPLLAQSDYGFYLSNNAVGAVFPWG